MWEWLSTSWFNYETLRQFEWAHPWFLYLLPGVPLLFLLRAWLHGRSRQRLRVAFLAREVRTSWVEYLRYLPALLAMVGVALVLIALARPQRVSQQVERSSEGIDIVLALDISESMLETDVLPNRLDAAKRVAKSFVLGRFQDRIGVVVFAGDAFSLCPLTTDYELINQSITGLDASLIRTAGTAIGSALGLSINRLRESKAKSKVIILLSDGDNTAGNLDPVTAAQLARVYGIRVYTIAVGERTRPVTDSLTTARVDEEILNQLATIGQGQFFRATDARTLGLIFSRINGLEKARVNTTRYREVRDFYNVYLRWAMVFLLLAFLTRSTFIGNVLED
ncbi:MAG: VWA domain-containing protein [Cytophagaceae bacterium]|nr:VWA domain-containing protein [Cytophagaceae bacterium]